MVDNGHHSRQDSAYPGQLRYPRGYPKRITLDLTVEDHHALLGARYADRVPMADRLPALVNRWRQDPALAEAVSTRAQQLLLAAGPSPATTPAPEPAAAALDPQAPPAS
jgi:hypothetical protein